MVKPTKEREVWGGDEMVMDERMDKIPTEQLIMKPRKSNSPHPCNCK